MANPRAGSCTRDSEEQSDRKGHHQGSRRKGLSRTVSSKETGTPMQAELRSGGFLDSLEVETVGNDSTKTGKEDQNEGGISKAPMGCGATSGAEDRLSTHSQSSKPCPPIPIPEKFASGNNYNRWEKQTQIYLRHFPHEKHADRVHSLLTGEAFDIVSKSRILNDEITDDTFKRIRQLLDTPKLAIEYRREFHPCRQRADENVRTYVRTLRHLADRAFPNLSSSERNPRILEQLVEGTSSASAQKEFYLQHPEELNEAVGRVELLKRRDAAIARQSRAQSPHTPYSFHVGTPRYSPPRSTANFRLPGRWTWRGRRGQRGP
ncbi:unnamed protein product [Echinostoma caproni]|uniref:Retrotrans_gag domain-containing protein n=1 Tax=Echinostoma caproni TaxID=27848 RepID=A0A183B6D6_9TREM|nr:unnamed protein product [Echinostoma caproni]